VLKQMRSIRSMRRGSISEQHLRSAPRAGRSTPVLHGPYYVFSRRENDRTVSHRLRLASELEQARQDVATHTRFVALCAEFERLTEQLGELERQQPELTQEKKRRRSPSNKTKK
jgi:hypothetical protein